MARVVIISSDQEVECAEYIIVLFEQLKPPLSFVSRLAKLPDRH